MRYKLHIHSYRLHTATKTDAKRVRDFLKAQNISSSTVKVLCPDRCAEDYRDVFGVVDNRVVLVILKPFISAQAIKDTLTANGFAVQMHYEDDARSTNRKANFPMTLAEIW